MNELLRNSLFKQLIPVALLACLFWLGFVVLRNFIPVIMWSCIIAYVMWPPYRWLKARLHNQSPLSAAAMTALISVTIGLAIYWLIALLESEVQSVYQTLQTNFADSPYQLPPNVKQLPWLGHYLQQYLDQINADEAGVKAQLINWARQWLGELGGFIGKVGKHILEFVFILVTLFFCFRDGGRIIEQLRQGFGVFMGDYQAIYLRAAGDTTRAVVYGLVLAALGQGLAAGLGYAVVGVEAPALLGVATALLAMVPMGATLIWLPIGLGLLVSGDSWRGIGLLLWGFLVISTVDNIIRPLVISGAGKIPFLVVMFGVLGGLAGFGAVGLFLGPIILSVLLAVWQAWLEQQKPLE